MIAEVSPMKRIFVWLAATALSASIVPAADVWQIDPAHSSATFAVTHLLISTVRGEFGKMSGTIEYDGTNVSSIKADATIDATTISTRNEYRDKDLKSDHFFDVAKYPTLTFKSKKVAAGAGGGFQIVGDLTMHGVTKEVALDATGPSKVIKGAKGESRVAASATTKINRQDFGIVGGAGAAGDTVTITIDIEAMLTPVIAPTKPAAK
jgi:polyisoprenoid-binding protein YceI